MNKLLVISGPLISFGRSGASWGKDYFEWDAVSHPSLADILYNQREASLRGYEVVFVCWEQDLKQELVSHVRDLNVIALSDSFSKFENSISPELNRDQFVIQKFGWDGKHRLKNDQRQLLGIKAGIDFGREKGFRDILRIRSDQTFDWDLLDRDFELALSNRRLFFPAQKDFTELDRGNTGFAILDFFIGGAIEEVDFLVRLALSQGRLVGPHQDLIWKYLPFNSTWSLTHPGLSTFRATNNRVTQKDYARDFWSFIARPCSVENMKAMTWRGIPLNKIVYNISSENKVLIQNVSKVEIVEEDYDSTDSKLHFKDYDWTLLSRFITGTKEDDSKLHLEAYTQLFLDYARHIGSKKSLRPALVLQLAIQSSYMMAIAQCQRSKLWKVCARFKKSLSRIKLVFQVLARDWW